MAPQASGFSPLRVVTQRLSSTPAKHMARVAPCLAASILDCKEILSSSTSHGVGKEASEASVVVHKFKSQLSALLQEKAVEARWSAVVLIKATIQAGGWEFLRGCGSWVRGLLGLLGVRQSCQSVSLFGLTAICFLRWGQRIKPCSLSSICLGLTLTNLHSSACPLPTCCYKLSFAGRLLTPTLTETRSRNDQEALHYHYN